MEDIQRNLDKELAALSGPKPPRRSKRWTFMLIGARGKVLSFRRFKGFVFTFLLLFLVMAAAAVVLYLLHTKSLETIRSLTADRDRLRQQLASLQDERDIMLARLVVTETNLATLEKSSLAGEAVKKEKPVDAVPPVGDADKSPVIVEPVSESDQQERPKITTEVKPSEEPPGKPDLPSLVAVEDFKVTYEPGRQTCRAIFTLRNVSTDPKQISGYTAVVLKNDQLPQEQWLTMPNVTLRAGKPGGAKRGQYFSIARFKKVYFVSTHQTDPVRFDRAVVFVFNQQKKLILEKEFLLQIETIGDRQGR